MLRATLLACCLLGTGCLLLERDGFDDDDDSASPPRPPPPWASTCGDGKVEGREACDDGNEIRGDGCSTSCQRDLPVRVSWNLATLAGQEQPCPAGFDLAEVVARKDVWTVPYTKTFPCDAGTGEVMLEQLSTPTDYDLQVFIKSTSGELYGQSTIDRVVASQPPHETDHTIVTDAGMIRVFAYPYLGTQPRFCNGIPLTSYDVVVRGQTGAPVTHTFSCLHGGVTGLLPTGTYRVEVSAVSGTGAAASAVVEAVAVPAGGKTTDPVIVNLVF